MINKRGKAATQILIMLVVVVITSAAVFSLVQAGVIKVKEVDGASILNTEFIPFMREGSLVIKGFKFCGDVGEDYSCAGEGSTFSLGDDVHFRFIVESSTVDGEVMLVENYRVKGPTGEVLLEVDEKNNYYFDLSSRKNKELVYFSDYFIVGAGLEEGEYALELLIENPLLNKKTTLVKKFEMHKKVFAPK